MRPCFRAVAATLALAGATLPASGQVKNRWLLEWSNHKPRLFTFQDPLGKKTNYFYVVYELRNTTQEMVPLAVDVTLHTDHGGDLHHDVRKSLPPVSHAGRWYGEVFHPLVEQAIVSREEQLGRRSPGLALERYEELKREGRYLNMLDLRRRHVLRPGETVGGLAVFADVDLRTDILELFVSGLVDVVHVDKVTPEGIQFSYENRVRRILYDYSGDEFDRHLDTVTAAGTAREQWEVRQIGPSSDKETVGRLVEFLEEPGDDPAIRSTAIGLLRQITPVQDGHGYDPAKSVADNLAATRKWREWWIRNRHRLVHNAATNVFEIKDEVLPGTAEPPPDEKADPTGR